ncbi:ssDNA-binding transcriptional regulator [Phycomyces blakesleeanus]|uniref:SsDNA-binding transcriptional regulator n=2 Tax=Phycomyces blakesleeanus TaxID=4837 RepID=A0A163EPX4_PHYB8|nr:ssDNA-binding transcriptional regulator [Phycomyces blakesleeanus NRRL 1555(-)]OAD80730.1 ssDNA-binding transcriptional regulator [Phycomyces blakesleeanus NRRL 1555(-)]|eukprot:XP_018298770.1 ssDNA-binding transcriptional regulator [Phycomyces blakesleeanus NRRL 1555(-)]
MVKTNKYIEDSDDEDFKPTKRVVSEDEDSEEEPSSKKPKKAEKESKEKSKGSSTPDESGAVFELSSKRKITVKAFPKGGAFVDIREFYTDKSGETKHGKGICLPLAQYKILKDLIPKIDAAIEKL